jgi:hypothetical protein
MKIVKLIAVIGLLATCVQACRSKEEVLVIKG